MTGPKIKTAPPPPKPTLTAPERQALVGLWEYGNAAWGLQGLYALNRLRDTMAGLLERGLVQSDWANGNAYAITEAGLEAIR